MGRAFIAFYPGDYLRDTQHLNTEEHGAYLLLLMCCWIHGTIPSKPGSRAKTAKISLRKWYKIRAKIEPFFDENGCNKRATIEREKAESLSTKQALKGLRSANKRWGYGNPDVTTVSNRGHGTNGNRGVTIKKESKTTSFFPTTAREGAGANNSGSVPAELPVGLAEEAREKVRKSSSVPVTGELQEIIRKRWAP